MEGRGSAVVDSPSGVSSVAGTPGGGGSPGRLLLRRRGRVMIFGIGRTSSSSETLVAAWNACRRNDPDQIG